MWNFGVGNNNFHLLHFRDTFKGELWLDWRSASLNARLEETLKLPEEKENIFKIHTLELKRPRIAKEISQILTNELRWNFKAWRAKDKKKIT